MTEVVEVIIQPSTVIEVEVEAPVAAVEVNLGIAGNPGPEGPPGAVPDPGDLTLIFDNQLI